MPAKRKQAEAATLRPRIRISRGTDIALGPGKADLLQAILDCGTIAAAAQQLGMSYMRAWTLIQTMNHWFKQPLVETTRGGSGRGAAAVTEAGKTVLRLYRQMETHCIAATESDWRELQEHLRP